MQSSVYLSRLLGQDRAAFNSLIKHYQPRLMAFAASIAGEDLAEELVQDAWISI